MEILISKNFVESLKIDNKYLFYVLKKILIYDGFLNENDEPSFFIKSDLKFQGVYIPKSNDVIYFTQKLGTNNLPKSRNTYLSQNFWPAYNFANKHSFSFSISFNPIDFDNNNFPDLPSSIIFNIRELVTKQILINNSFFNVIKNKNIVPFSSINEYLFEKQKLSWKNKGNKPTYITTIDGDIFIYFKFDGANKALSLFNLLIINYFYRQNNFNIKLYAIPLTKNKIGNQDLNFIKNLGFNIDYTNVDLTNKSIINQDEVKRRQAIFYKNILLKYENVKNCNQCFICNHLFNLVSSHIKRFADIKEEYNFKKLSVEDAILESVDGENGFLLCPNHDKAFENGLIYFDIKLHKFVINENSLQITSKKELNYLIDYLDFKNNNFPEECLTKKFEYYVNCHINRILNKK